MTNPAAISPQQAGISPRMVLNALRRWWKLAFPLGLVLGAAAAAGVFFTFEPEYQATRWLQISRNLLIDDEQLPKEFVDNQLSTIRGPKVLSAVLSDPAVARVPEIQEAENPIGWLAENLALNAVGQSEFYKLSIVCRDPNDAKAIVTAVTDYYKKVYEAEHADMLNSMQDLWAQRRTTYESKLQEDTDRISQLLESDPTLLPRREATPEDDPIFALQGQLTQVQIDRETLQIRLQSLKAAGSSNLPVSEEDVQLAVEVDPRVVALRTEQEVLLGEKEKADRQLAELSLKDIRGRRTGELKEITKRIAAKLAEVQAELSKVRGELAGEKREEFQKNSTSTFAQLQSELDYLLITEDLLTKRLESEVTLGGVKASSLTELKLAEARLERTRSIHSQTLDNLETIDRLKKVPPTVKIDETTLVPSVPLEKYPTKLLILAFGGCFTLPFALAVLYEWLLRRVDHRAELEQHAPQLPVIGEIPSFSGWRRRQENCLESVDSLRTRLVLSEPLKDMRTLAVVSSVSGEGKTSVATQLAASLARSTTQPVLLIDADMRRPDIHSIFDIPLSPGLAEVLDSDCEIADSISKLPDSNLHILPAGDLRTNPHRLTNSGNLERLIEVLVQQYRYVVIDTPPVLAASEALTIARAADGCLLCTMRDVTRVDQFRSVCDNLRATGAQPAGVVLSGVSQLQYARTYGNYQYSYSER